MISIAPLLIILLWHAACAFPAHLGVFNRPHTYRPVPSIPLRLRSVTDDTRLATVPLLCRTPPALLPPAQEQCQHLYLRAAKSQDRGCSRLRAATSARGHLCHTTWRSAPVHAPRSSGQRCGQRVWRWLLALRRKPPRAFSFRYLASLRAEYVFHIFHMRSIYRHVYSYSGGVSTGGSGRTSCAWERGRVLGLKRFDFPEIRFDFAAYTRRRLLFPRNPELRTCNTDCCSNI